MAYINGKEILDFIRFGIGDSGGIDQEKIEIRGLAYTLNADGASYTCVGVCSDRPNNVIESEVNGLPVTSIGGWAFAFHWHSSWTIPASVESIGDYAFNECTELQNVTFAEGSKCASISKGMFEGCTSLKSIIIPASVESIGYRAFMNCTELQTVTFAEGSKCASIGGIAFKGCTSLKSIIIPASVESIGNYAFKGCTSLTITNNNENTIDFGRYWNPDKLPVKSVQYILSGDWVFFETPTLPTEPIEQAINFHFKGNDLLWIKITAGFESEYIAYTLYDGAIVTPFCGFWMDHDKRYITFDAAQEVSKEFYNWFTGNAEQVEA